MLLERFQFPHNYVVVQVMLIHCKEQKKKNPPTEISQFSRKNIFFLQEKKLCLGPTKIKSLKRYFSKNLVKRHTSHLKPPTGTRQTLNMSINQQHSAYFKLQLQARHTNYLKDHSTISFIIGISAIITHTQKFRREVVIPAQPFKHKNPT